jgi:hypothetical protein
MREFPTTDGWFRCDDCRKVYAGPAYYTFDPEGHDGDHAHICTGSLCPEDAGPYLVPDDPDDPRRPNGG